jgi:hypothetical protein
MSKRRRNQGIRKRCRCPRTAWGRCRHAWHFNFKWRGTVYRVSLDKTAGRPPRKREDARAEADRLRSAIRAGEYPPVPDNAQQIPSTTFRQFAKLWLEREGSRLA